MREKIRIIARNLADTATLTATTETTPVTGLQLSTREDVWRSTVLINRKITVTLAKKSYIDGLSLAHHNLSPTASITVVFKLSGQPDVTYNLSPVSIIPLGVWQVGIDEYGATYDDKINVRAATLWLSEIVLADSIEITINDVDNDDGYIEIGRLFAGNSIQPKFNYSWGAQVEFIEDTEHTRTEAGSLRSEGNNVFRQIAISLDYLDYADKSRLEIDMAYAGQDRDILISLTPGVGGLEEITNTFIGRRLHNFKTTTNFRNNYRSQLVIQEA